MTMLIWVIIVCVALVLILDHSIKKDREAMERKESAEFGLERSEYQFQKIFESPEKFTNEFLSWLTGRNVSSTVGYEGLVSVKTVGLDRISVSLVHGACDISLCGTYYSTEGGNMMNLQILISPNSIVDKDTRANPYVVVESGLSDVFDENFFEERKYFYELQKETPVMKGFVPALTEILELYKISSCKEYYVALCRKIEWVARDLEAQLVSKGFRPWKGFPKRQT